MPILDFCSSTANKDMISKMWENGDTDIWLSRKHCGKKRKSLVTSNFSFSHNVFKSSLVLMHQNEYLWSERLRDHCSDTTPHHKQFISLTLYHCHTIPTFNDPKEDVFEKLWEKEKMLVTSISPFPIVFSTLSSLELVILAMFNLSSANVCNLVMSKIL